MRPKKIRINPLTASRLSKLRERLYGDGGGDNSCFSSCCDCCACKECTGNGSILGSYTTGPDVPCWDLTSYQEEGLLGGKICGRSWDIVDIAYGNYPVGGGSPVTEDGTLSGMPSQYCDPYPYPAYLRLRECCEGRCPNVNA